MNTLRLVFTAVFAILVIGADAAFAEGGEAPRETPAPEQGGAANEEKKKPLREALAEVPVITSDPYCDAIADPAREQRYLLKQEELKMLLASVNERVAELEKRKTEYEKWVKRREDFAKLASKNLVEIYAAMKPEASAVRMTELTPELAASLLLSISPRQASAILNEMDEKVAAALTGIMAASARKKDPS